jgi:hypothetical protein
VNDLEGWQTVQVKIAAGVPPRQAFLEAGYSDEQCDKWGMPDQPVLVAAPALVPPVLVPPPASTG